jgi:hypothetical protein
MKMKVALVLEGGAVIDEAGSDNDNAMLSHHQGSSPSSDKKIIKVALAREGGYAFPDLLLLLLFFF